MLPDTTVAVLAFHIVVIDIVNQLLTDSAVCFGYLVRLAVNSHQKITADRMEGLAKSIDKFNDNSGTLAKAANWLAAALVILGVAQVIVAVLHH